MAHKIDLQVATCELGIAALPIILATKLEPKKPTSMRPASARFPVSSFEDYSTSAALCAIISSGSSSIIITMWPSARVPNGLVVGQKELVVGRQIEPGASIRIY